MIPRLEESVRYIATELDEMEREDFVRLKKVRVHVRVDVRVEPSQSPAGRMSLWTGPRPSRILQRRTSNKALAIRMR